MSFDVLEKLEAKIQAAVDTISLLQMEVDELKEQNGRLDEENQQLKQQHDAWQERLRVLLGKIDQVEEHA
ncbi:cell division protein ZapB [Zobellella denitrificans]|jgi:cell division protein ZapB|uniref:Cell division protein ZapB n=1 Tax=Zobellella denitrificans TaxID=347534 RepID=A0A231N180_9GAMM|nr:cell division protein ZapB [Zobellella denitrificans]ATG72587.1 cell division protein ZapB [Zobellella denitrificans]OXS16237.1 cell division protein ZapB [Zobellella denitrificans]